MNCLVGEKSSLLKFIETCEDTSYLSQPSQLGGVYNFLAKRKIFRLQKYLKHNVMFYTIFCH